VFYAEEDVQQEIQDEVVQEAHQEGRQKNVVFAMKILIPQFKDVNIQYAKLASKE
jgi:hypothetical protein